MSKRVLVVEDEEDIRRLVSIKLKGAGYEVTTASDEEEGLAAAVRDKLEGIAQGGAEDLGLD